MKIHIVKMLLFIFDKTNNLVLVIFVLRKRMHASLIQWLCHTLTAYYVLEQTTKTLD